MDPVIWKSLIRISECTRAQHIEYAKTKSYATLKKEDPNFVPPNALPVDVKESRLANGSSSSEKRRRDDQMDADERSSKREKATEDDDDDDEEMEIEDDEDTGAKPSDAASNGASMMMFYPVFPLHPHFVISVSYTNGSPTSFGTPLMYKLAARSHRRRAFCTFPTVCNHDTPF